MGLLRHMHTGMLEKRLFIGKGKISRTAKKHKNNEILCDISLHLRFNGANPYLDSNLRRFEPSSSARRLYPRARFLHWQRYSTQNPLYKVVPDQGSICPTALWLEMDRENNSTQRLKNRK